jgi:hypothetical protein
MRYQRDGKTLAGQRDAARIILSDPGKFGNSKRLMQWAQRTLAQPVRRAPSKPARQIALDFWTGSKR